MFVEGDTGHQTRFSLRVVCNSGAPPFHGVSDKASVFGKGFAPTLEFKWEIADVVRGFFQLPGVSTGEDTGARGSAFSCGRVDIVEQDAVFGNAIEVWGFDPLCSVDTRVKPPVVGEGKEDVRRCLFVGGLQCDGGER